ncbi:hypothetical protein WS70_08860 [Burkholderia mayonis]|uniref:Uncharacterized protein n=1 Tax=Burkholderia mayonis TaxID=1385591 RepID=A0A1B4FED4_9BURK|nr:hypothetical protein WS70_08860 [Burkholderia mayonis]KVE40396.1 hypothetical protein WS70_18000 [Burkholderia mayonis]
MNFPFCHADRPSNAFGVDRPVGETARHIETRCRHLDRAAASSTSAAPVRIRFQIGATFFFRHEPMRSR